MIAIAIRERGATPRHMVKAMRAAKKAAYQAAGEWWHRECRPKHFTRQAYQEYAYVRRMGEGGTATKVFRKSYTGRKLKKFGHTNPAVWSGVSERLARVRDVRATSTGCRVVIPTIALVMHAKGGRIKMKAELETVTRGEAARIGKIIDRVIDNRLRAFQETSERTL